MMLLLLLSVRDQDGNTLCCYATQGRVNIYTFPAPTLSCVRINEHFKFVSFTCHKAINSKSFHSDYLCWLSAGAKDLFPVGFTECMEGERNEEKREIFSMCAFT
jgi:hypothetical protein